MRNPHQVTRDFEAALCEYTGAKYAVAVNSCTMALTLALAWWLRCGHARSPFIAVPRRTYVSVPMAVLWAGGAIEFVDLPWSGSYPLRPSPVIDSARLFTALMYQPGEMRCVSFHASKTLGLEQGGAILHDNASADAWLRRARFDGRAEGVAPTDDPGIIIGWHCYMNPSTAALGILRLHSLPRFNPPLPNDDYPDLSTLECFR